MVRLSLLFAACVAAAATGVVHAESEAEAARVKVVLRVHEHGKSVSDTIGDVWDTVKNETSDAIESVADEFHDALYGSGSNDTEDEPVEIVVVKQTVLNHKVVNSKTIVRHFKEGEEEEGEGEGEEALIEEIENALFGSEAGSASTSGSGSNSTEATEVGDENEGSTEKELTAEDEGSLGEEEEEEEEEGELPMPPPVKKHHKKKHHAAKHHAAKKHHHAKKHHEAKKQQAVKEEVKTVQKETNTMATATDVHTERRPSTTFVLIGAAVGAMVGIVALAVFVAVRRRRSTSSASVLATHESDVEAINQEEEDDEEVEDAAAPVVEDLEKGDAKAEETLEGSV